MEKIWSNLEVSYSNSFPFPITVHYTLKLHCYLLLFEGKHSNSYYNNDSNLSRTVITIIIYRYPSNQGGWVAMQGLQGMFYLNRTRANLRYSLNFNDGLLSLCNFPVVFNVT